MKKHLFFLITFLSLFVGAVQAQQQCYTLINGLWTWNGTCSQTATAPWQITPGKTFSILNTLTIKGIDNQTIDFSGLPQGSLKLGTAALASTQSFQPSGGALNLVGIDNTTSVTNGTSTSCSVGAKTWSAISPTSLGFTTGMIVTAIETANPQVYMQGSVCSYSGTTVTINSTYSQGTFTGTGWTIQISGPQGPQGAQGTSGNPVGSGELWYSTSLPINYLWCSGPSFTACVSTTTYSGLYAVIGDTWTTHNGCSAGNFGLPDMRGSLPIGAGQGQTHEGGGTGTNRVLGQFGGAETHTQAGTEVAQTPISAYDSGHTHPPASQNYFIVSNNTGGGVGAVTAAQFSVGFAATTSVGYANITGTAGNANPNPMTIMNPFTVVNYIIRYQ